MNFQHLDFPRYTLPLIEHDYPARTPAMWNSAYRAFGIDAANVMLVGNANQTSRILEILRGDPRYLGGGAGVGFKEKAFNHVDEKDPLADRVGSINFISRTGGGRLRGHNTDGIGYAVALESVLQDQAEQLRGKKVLILGAGGTACAIAFALAECGAQLSIVNRTASKATALAARVNEAYGEGRANGSGEDDIERCAVTADIVVNVSTKGSVGPLAEYLAPGPAELPPTEENLRRNLNRAIELFDRIPRRAILSDVVIVHGQTPFLRHAQERGFTTLDGLPMVVNQAIEAFWILHGQELLARQASKEDLAQVMRDAAARSEKTTGQPTPTT
jgi:shikimate dehydrogenase